MNKEENEEIDILFKYLMDNKKLKYPLKQERQIIMDKYEKKKVRSKSGYTKFLQPNQKRECLEEMIDIMIMYSEEED